MIKLMDNFNESVTEVEAFYVLDLDRCLVDSDKLHKLLEEIVAKETSITNKELSSARLVAEQTGETFDTTLYIHQALGEIRAKELWPHLQRLFVEEVKKHEVLEPYARELIAILDKKHLPYGIVTYGVETWQLAKLIACNLIEVPYEITRIKKKGELFKGWKHNNSSFTIPPGLFKGPGTLVARSVVFLDDKAVSFQGIPEGVRGIRVKQLDKPVFLSQAGPLPAGVEEVEGILEAIRVLFEDEYRRIIDKA
jgi:hypothetical protein